MRLFSIILNLFFFCTLSYSQLSRSVKDPVSGVPIDTVAISIYQRLMDHNYDLINGRAYLPYHSRKSNPFFKSAFGASGTVYCKDRTYKDLLIIYDIFKDELVLNYVNPVGELRLISLNKNYVDSFLIVINKEPTMFHMLYFPENSKLESGFYEIIYKGKTDLLMKHRMEYKLKDGLDYYVYSPFKYICINGNYSRITTLSGFLKLFGTNKPAMKKFVDSISLYSFRDATLGQMVQILNYYETL
jgi:hypothetical protein